MKSPREHLKTVSFQLANVDHVPELLALYEQFFAEASYKDFIEFDSDRAGDYLVRVIGSGACPHILAVIDEKIVGLVSYSLDHTFSKKPVAVMGELYVVPAHRRSALGRVLVAQACDLAKGDDACAFHAPVASGLKEARSLFNLFQKGGFQSFGYMMRRGL